MDAVVTREFDLAGKTFVDAAEGGFELPEAKSSVAWAGPDTVFVATDFGPGSLTNSGYPRIVKLWRREQPLAQAEVVFEGEASDVSVSAAADLAPGFEVQFVRRGTDFFHSEVFVRRPESGELVPLPKPADAAFSALRGRLFLELKSDWTTAQGTFAAGSLLSARLEDFLAHPPGEATLDVLFEPEAGVFLTDYAPTRGHVILNVLDHVRSRVYVATPPQGERSGAAWTRRPLLPRGANGTEFRTVRVQAVDPDEDDRYFMYTNDYLTPSTLSLGTAAEAGAPPEILKQATARFDAEGLTMAQHWAVSADGTRIPYFQVGPRDAGPEGVYPTLLHGYGGFQISMLPGYSAGIGIGWLSRGGVYVVANIRGGGEFGPAWHRAALRENRGRGLRGPHRGGRGFGAPPRHGTEQARRARREQRRLADGQHAGSPPGAVRRGWCRWCRSSTCAATMCCWPGRAGLPSSAIRTIPTIGASCATTRPTTTSTPTSPIRRC